MSGLAKRLLSLVTDQLPLDLDRRPASSDELLVRLRGLGLQGIDRCVLTHNRSEEVRARARDRAAADPHPVVRRLAGLPD